MCERNLSVKGRTEEMINVNIENIPITFVVFGDTGSGKSTAANTLTESNKFKESLATKAETKLTIGELGTFDGVETCLIDTPGMNDAEGTDTPHLIQMANYIRQHKEMKAFVIVINFNNPRLDNSVKRLFQLVANMYPGKKWYKNLAVVWAQCYHFFPKDFKEMRMRELLSGFTEFMKTYILPNVSEDEINDIPKYFVDSVHAREQGSESREEYKHLLTWISTLQPMGMITTVDSEIKKIVEERERRIIKDELKFNVKIVSSKEFKRNKNIHYDGRITFGEWEEVPGSLQEKRETLPVEPIKGKEKRERQIRTIEEGNIRRIVDPNRTEYGSRRYFGLFGPRSSIEHGDFHQTYVDIEEERIVQPMSDGSIHTGSWIEIGRKKRNKIIGSF